MWIEGVCFFGIWDAHNQSVVVEHRCIGHRIGAVYKRIVPGLLRLPADDQPALKLLRTYALFWSTPTIIAALTAFIFLSQHNERHFQNMMDLWWLLALSVGFHVSHMVAVQRTPLRTGFICVMSAFFLCIFAYGIGQYPYILIRTLPFRAGHA